MGNKVKALKPVILIALSIMILLSLLSGSAHAITGHYQIDSTSYVGIVVFFNAQQQPISYCSGTLISPTVILTAGHGTHGAAFAIACFDQGPFDYSFQNGQLSYYGNEPLHTGVPVTYPSYSLNVEAGTKAKDVLSVSDLGLVILDTPVQGVTKFATLPKVNFDDSLSVKTNLKVIGYGEQTTAPPANSLLTSLSGTLSRNSATVQLLSDHFAGSEHYIKCTTNPSHGRGGVSFGDSGGPVIYQTRNGHNILLAINAYLNNANGYGPSYHTRVDNPQVLNWINAFLGKERDRNSITIQS